MIFLRTVRFGFSPAVSLLPVPGLLLGFSLGASIQIGLLFCGIVGGIGWLFFFERMNLCSSTLLVLAIMLGLLAGNATAIFSTGNIILFALVPWFIIWTFKIDSSIVGPNFSTQTLLLLLVFLFFSALSLDKAVGIIIAGTIGAYLFFLLSVNLCGSEISILRFSWCLESFLVPVGKKHQSPSQRNFSISSMEAS